MNPLARSRLALATALVKSPQLLARTFVLGSIDAPLSLAHHVEGPFYMSPITFGESPP